MRKLQLLIVFIVLLIPISGLAENLHIEFLDVGKADAILIYSGDTTIVIDAATNSKGKTVVKRLGELGRDHIDLMVITHFDKDHVGGADRIIKAFPVEMIYVPDYTSDSKQTMQFFEAVEEYAVNCEALSENRAVAFGDILLYFDVANEKDYGQDEENDFSLVTTLSYGDTKVLFAGDAENPRLGELLLEGVEQCDVLKVPHHGRKEKLSASFIDTVHPKDAVITSDDDNLEDASVVRALNDVGANVWLTRLGNVYMELDGKGVTVRQEK